MSDNRRRTVTTVETHELWVIRRPVEEVCDMPCAKCPGGTSMLTLPEAAERAGVSQRTIYRWLEGGRIHFAETADGRLFVCLAPLVADV